jgi:hypothetical protein
MLIIGGVEGEGKEKETDRQMRLPFQSWVTSKVCKFGTTSFGGVSEGLKLHLYIPGSGSSLDGGSREGGKGWGGLSSLGYYRLICRK